MGPMTKLLARYNHSTTTTTMTTMTTMTTTTMLARRKPALSKDHTSLLLFGIFLPLVSLALSLLDSPRKNLSL
jgi:hypothetical protein